MLIITTNISRWCQFCGDDDDDEGLYAIVVEGLCKFGPLDVKVGCGY